jgi:hypothetical protein
LLFGPHGFGGRTYLSSFDGDRCVCLDLGAFAFGAGLRVAIIGSFPRAIAAASTAARLSNVKNAIASKSQDERAPALDDVNCCMATHRAPKAMVGKSAIAVCRARPSSSSPER